MIIEVEFAHRTWFFGFLFPRLAAGRMSLMMLTVCGLLFVLIAWHSVYCGPRRRVYCGRFSRT